MTPYEFALFLKGQKEAEIRSIQNDFTVAFQGEQFARKDKLTGKHLEKAVELVGKAQAKKRRVQTEQEQWDVMKAITAGLGGKVMIDG